MLTTYTPCKCEMFACKHPALVTLVTFGRAGHVIYCAPRAKVTSRLEGYEVPESFLRELIEGRYNPRDERSTGGQRSNGYTFPDVPIIDVRAAVETDRGYAHVFRGPLYSVEIETGRRRRFMADADEPINEEPPRALDSVAREEYIDGWREAGARIGRLELEAGEPIIVWEDGERMRAAAPREARA